MENTLDLTYRNNLLFYKILKSLIQCKLKDAKLILLQTQIKTFIDNNYNNALEIKKMFLNGEDIVKSEINTRSNFETFINMINDENVSLFLVLTDLAIDLLLFKDQIIIESKMFVNKKIKEVNVRIKDKLSIAYDLSTLDLPYGTRVATTILSNILLDEKRNTNFMLENTNKELKNIQSKLMLCKEQYLINPNSIYSLIISESVNQSIKSSAGMFYESRFYQSVLPFVDEINGHSHDSNIPSVEYDFTLLLNDKKIGVSVKRTLRERYKQNFEDISFLDVDYMIVATLGIDLNKDKLDRILQRDKIFVIVASELYNSKDYFKNNPKVISSEKISRELFVSLFVG